MSIVNSGTLHIFRLRDPLYIFLILDPESFQKDLDPCHPLTT